MSKPAKDKPTDDIDMRAHYDFSSGVRGKYRHVIGKPYTRKVHHENGSTTIEQVEPSAGVVVLEPDVQAYFADSEAVNKALRGLIALIPQSRAAKAPDKPK